MVTAVSQADVTKLGAATVTLKARDAGWDLYGDDYCDGRERGVDYYWLRWWCSRVSRWLLVVG